MILSPTQRRSLERALALAKGTEDRLDYFEKLSAVSPALEERTKILRERQRYLISLSELALTADTATSR